MSGFLRFLVSLACFSRYVVEFLLGSALGFLGFTFFALNLRGGFAGVGGGDGGDVGGVDVDEGGGGGVVVEDFGGRGGASVGARRED